MALILCIETSTKSCSVALSLQGKSIVDRELISKNYSHSEKLTVFVQELMNQSGYEFFQLDAIAISMGPGSYTGLRIGVSTAKGICYASEKPLIAISTLEAMAKGMESKEQNKCYCPMIDARRMEVYCGLYGNIQSDVQAKILEENSFHEELNHGEILFFGDGAHKFKALCKHPNAHFVNDIFPSAKDMCLLAQQAFDRKEFKDVAYFEPFYLKDFVAGPHK
ncbi:MAG: tRNA (adenosine(37)-N6)-threonylcarbamoyltransferase complex dimerization subunit type 1 TsaB [Flavobacteriales bacterium]